MRARSGKTSKNDKTLPGLPAPRRLPKLPARPIAPPRRIPSKGR
ncbi:hypothetical protein AB0K40_43270 [Nonomuraea bangladeshensis]|jgi:hypothetical protein|uniref:Uncharacterized protein n=1 Tax=Nonomuraea bangladeshensis TaxID=404385 RepID=A0ABV3HIJ7_9ACTN|nr:hypothetical protein [Nonomuraea sp. LP-02]MED7924043.1 hypothetical protein [Nonomuraea sp. LP-02]